MDIIVAVIVGIVVGVGFHIVAMPPQRIKEDTSDLNKRIKK